MYKHYKKVGILFTALLFTSLISAPAFADSGFTWTDQTAATTQPWAGVASSSTGQYLVGVVHGGDIYTSNDYGADWTDQSTYSGSWQSVASSASGQYMTTVQSSGDIWVSSDYGQTWSDQTSSGTFSGGEDWYSVTMSSTGQYQYAVDLGGNLAVSNDYGQTWTDETANLPSTNLYFYSITSSSSGQYLAAAVLFGGIYTSNDYGADWTLTSAPTDGNWFEVSSSSTGQYLAGADAYGDIWTSNDYGADWTDQVGSAGSGNEDWWTVSESANGQVLLAGVWFGDLFTSTDGGVTWNDQTQAGSHGWYASAMSSDGSRMIAADGDGFGRYNGSGGDLWTSFDPALVVSNNSGNTSPPASTPNTGSPDTGYGEPLSTSPAVKMIEIVSGVSIGVGLLMMWKQNLNKKIAEIKKLRSL